ncbi:hypothetical protein TMRO357_02424 [Alteriqipengyuania sp. 357]
MGRVRDTIELGRQNLPLVTLMVLLAVTFATGGSARAEVMSLALLRPVGVICLGIGLIGIDGAAWRAHRLALIFMAAILGLILIHLIPLPPAIWMALPGRELAVQAGEAVGGTQPWRPIALVPYRAWNAFYAMVIPAAAMVLAAQIPTDKLRLALYAIIAFAIASSLWAIVQTVSGFNESFYFYRVSSGGSANGLFANRNHQAALLVLSLPTLALVASRITGPNRLVMLALSAGLGMLLLLLVFATGSRAGLAFSLAALGLCYPIWLARPHDRRVPRRGLRRNYAAPALAIGLLVALAILAMVLSRAEGLERIFAGGQVEQNRLSTWSTIVGFMGHYMPVGSGVGSFVEIFQVHEPSDLLSGPYWNHAHNDWLEWTLEGGVLAIIPMAAGLLAYALRTWQLIRTDGKGRLRYQMAVLAAAVIFILGLWSVVDYPLRTPSLAVIASLCAVWLTRPQLGKGQAMPDGTVG